jgi:hypothetical protein
MSDFRNGERPRERLAALIQENRKLPLGRYLPALARASAMASVIAIAGCGDDPWIDTEDASLPICEGVGTPGEPPFRWRPTQGLNPAVDYDALQVYRLDEGPGLSPYLLDSDGEPCAAATDPDSCEMLVEAAAEIRTVHLTTTSGDVVETFADQEELMRFLGTVDTAQEALLVALFDRKTIQCGDSALGSARRVADGYEVIVTQVTASCDPLEYSRFLLHVSADGIVTQLRSEVYESSSGVCIGRRPDGLARQDPCHANTRAGRHFAGIATLEAAAVIAFERLADDLERLGAPPALVADARKAAQDEVRHAEVMTGVARHFGAEPESPAVAQVPPRDPYSIALENAVEGSIRETFGALTGSYQALAATDPLVAKAMRTVSEDEIFHAELSARVDAFLDTLLTESERASVAAARKRAIAELRLEMSIEPEDEIAEVAGLPPRELALHWIDCLQQDIWAA